MNLFAIFKFLYHKFYTAKYTEIKTSVPGHFLHKLYSLAVKQDFFEIKRRKSGEVVSTVESQKIGNAQVPTVVVASAATEYSYSERHKNVIMIT